MPATYRNPSRPLDPGLNAAVVTMAARLFPRGYDIGGDAPSTLEELNDHIAKTGRMMVWDGASDRTIFDDAEVNYAFRAWHDWHHWRHQFSFDVEGETSACESQIAQLKEVYGDNAITQRWAKIIRAEVIGQAEHFHKHGQFPADQMEFTRNALGEAHLER